MEKDYSTPRINISGRFIEVILPMGIDARSTKQCYLAIYNMKARGLADAEILERVGDLPAMATVMQALAGFGSLTIEIVERQIQIRANKPYSKKQICNFCKKRMYSQRGAAAALVNALKNTSVRTPKRMYFCEKSMSYHLTSNLQ